MVAAVELVVLGDALLDAEHLVTQRKRGGQLVLIAGAAHLIERRAGHPSAYRLMSFSSAPTLSYGPAWSKTM